MTDIAPPSTRIVSGPDAVEHRREAFFAFDSDDPSAAFECSLDGAALAPCASIIRVTGLGDGGHELVVRARDLAGNLDGTPAQWRWVIDTAPPDPAR
jgi:hypothetical protein